MAHGKEVREAVRAYYIRDRLSLEVAAARAGVAYGTARRWKSDSEESGDDWDKLRSAQMMAGGAIEDIARQMLNGMVLQYQSTIETLNLDTSIPSATKVQMLSSLADAYNKTISASKKIMPETSELATAMEVVQQLAEFVRTKYPKHVQAFAEILEPFADELARSYG
ncbi:DUF1804 family protein [Leeia sp. TBRC 13508]|uniref:DUF1804 family protein n=1 Tax=Leeia speluncae TaxID=2884804 RepID=A0ABS8D2A6_9NEIS|nr:DUF1804 family protein [Leeia speluncae]MCB6182326.1 DUF1804 family protein [Leeia speluncae]